MKAIISNLLGIPFQAGLSTVDPLQKEIAQLEGTILIPAVCIIFIVVIVSSIAMVAQKHKRL